VPVDEELTDISTTVWSFPTRGFWAPQMARALIEMYTEPGDLVLDPMVGSGTTCIEARLLGRNCIGVDISYGAAILSLHLFTGYIGLSGLLRRGSRDLLYLLI
jgi:hypothetical protein